MRGAEETLGKGGAGASTVVTERVAKATALAQDVSGDMSVNLDAVIAIGYLSRL